MSKIGLYCFCLKIHGFFLLFEPEISNQIGLFNKIATKEENKYVQ